MDCEKYLELAAADVDDRLTDGERSTAERHLASCPKCRELRRGQLEVRARIRGLESEAVPQGLRERLGSMPYVASETTEPVDLHAHRSPVRRMILGGAIAAALLLGLTSLMTPPESNLIATLHDDVATAAAESPDLGLRTTDAGRLREYYRREGIPFEESVEDFGTAGPHLVGGSVVPIGSVPATLTVYEDGNDRVLCRRFRSGSVAIPSGGQTVGDRLLFNRGGVHVAIKKMGDVVCAMASDMPRDQFMRSIRLARAD